MNANSVGPYGVYCSSISTCFVVKEGASWRLTSSLFQTPWRSERFLESSSGWLEVDNHHCDFIKTFLVD